MTLTLGKDFLSRTSHTSVLRWYSAATNRKRPAFLSNQICALVPYSQIRFGRGGQAILGEPNAGGSSEKSEALSIELLERVFGAELAHTEMGIPYQYDNYSKKTDYAMQWQNKTLGVSVTRAMNVVESFTSEDALHLLRKKLRGIKLSSRDTMIKWTKQILHIFTAKRGNVSLLEAAYEHVRTAERKLLSNTVVLVTWIQNAPWVFTNRQQTPAKAQLLWSRYFGASTVSPSECKLPPPQPTQPPESPAESPRDQQSLSEPPELSTHRACVLMNPGLASVVHVAVVPTSPDQTRETTGSIPADRLRRFPLPPVEKHVIEAEHVGTELPTSQANSSLHALLFPAGIPDSSTTLSSLTRSDTSFSWDPFLLTSRVCVSPNAQHHAYVIVDPVCGTANPILSSLKTAARRAHSPWWGLSTSLSWPRLLCLPPSGPGTLQNQENDHYRSASPVPRPVSSPPPVPCFLTRLRSVHSLSHNQPTWATHARDRN